MELKKAEDLIKVAWIAGIISGLLTLILSLVPGGMLEAGNVVDAMLIFGLSFGIYRKSRICAVLLLVYFILNTMVTWAERGVGPGLPVALIFGYCFIQGLRGTFAYHKIVKSIGSREAGIQKSEGGPETPDRKA
jgi:hypothetical protein